MKICRLYLFKKLEAMKSFIRHKQLFYSILSLHVFFLFMPVSQAGEIVLCYSNARCFEITLNPSKECSCCNEPSYESQEGNKCFCVDIPISKDADEHSTLLSNGTIQPKPQFCIQTHTANLLNPSHHDGLSNLINYPHFKITTYESLRSTVLLI
jgi:hypothetical protein